MVTRIIPGDVEEPRADGYGFRCFKPGFALALL